MPFEFKKNRDFLLFALLDSSLDAHTHKTFVVLPPPPLVTQPFKWIFVLFLLCFIFIFLNFYTSAKAGSLVSSST